jgi:hypothetical protein
MWEVMQTYVIILNMIIEDDRKNRVRTHVGLYECQDPLEEVDYEVPTDFADSSPCTQRSVTGMFTSNFNMISLSIREGSKDYQQIRRHIDLARLIIFVLYAIVCFILIWKQF